MNRFDISKPTHMAFLHLPLILVYTLISLLFTDFFSVYLGFICGMAISLLSFVLVFYMTHYALDKATNQNNGKMISMGLLVVRLAVYGILVLVSYVYIKVNIFSLIVGLASVQMIIISFSHFSRR